MSEHFFCKWNFVRNFFLSSISFIWFFFSLKDVLDNFLEVADLNQDGYLNYPEYAAAVNFGNAMATAQVNEDL